MNILAPVALRVNVDVSPSTHAKISTGERNTKFGVSTKQSEARDIYQQMAEDPHISPAGLAVHIGSQICDLGPFERAYSALLALAIELRDAGLPVPNLDLGGGIGIDYDTAGPTDFREYGLLVQRLFAGQGFHRRGTVGTGGVVMEVTGQILAGTGATGRTGHGSRQGGRHNILVH